MAQQINEAAGILLERRQCRRSLSKWACHVLPNISHGTYPAKHHQLLINELEKVVHGKTKKLAIFLPPGSAKSTYSSVLFPPWFLAQRTNSTILSCSCSIDLASSFGRKCRNIIDDCPEHLDFKLSPTSQAADRWETTNGGLYMAAGVGSKIAGRRADLGLIDDPIGSKEEADSKLIRDKIWEWYKFDFRPRLTPNAATVLIQTRWHEDDLAGRLLETEGAEWTVISIPMVAGDNDPLGRQPGELLWPEYFTQDMLADARKDDRAFNSLYQQNPTPDTGVFFTNEMLSVTYESAKELPKSMRIYVASDHAVGIGQQNDKTCIIPVGVDGDNHLWVLPDIVWDKLTSDKAVDAMIRVIQLRHPLVWWAEKGHITKSIGPFLRKRMIEEHAYCYIDEVNPARDKQTRAQSIHGRMSMGIVHFPSFATWWPDAKNQILRFPFGTHDDFVDALAHIGMGLDKIMGLQPRVEEPGFELKEVIMTGEWLKNNVKRQEATTVAERLDY